VGLFIQYRHHAAIKVRRTKAVAMKESASLASPANYRDRPVRCLRTSLQCLCLTAAFALGGCDRALEPAGHTAVAAGGIYAGAFSDNGNFAIVGSIHHGISFWRLSDAERLYDWKHSQSSDTTLTAADFSPDGNWALTAEKNTLVLWNTITGEAPRYWQAPAEILSVQLSLDGNRALLGLSDNTAVLFDVRAGGILQTLQHHGPVRSVALDGASNIAVTGSEDRTAVTWDLRNNKRLAMVQHDEEVQLVAISEDGQTVLSVSQYDKAVIWQSGNGALTAEIPLQAGRLKRGLRFTSARFSADKNFLLTGQTDQTVTLWPVKDLEHPTSWKVSSRRLWKPAGASVVDVAFTQEANTFVAMASNGLVYRLTLPVTK